jgi:hypothetical protein
MAVRVAPWSKTFVCVVDAKFDDVSHKNFEILALPSVPTLSGSSETQCMASCGTNDDEPSRGAVEGE